MIKNKAGMTEDDLPVTRRELYDVLQSIKEQLEDPNSHDHSARIMSSAIQTGIDYSELFDNLKKDAY